MNMEDEIFKGYFPVFENFRKYGFYNTKEGYEIIKPFIREDFKVQVVISHEGKVRAKVLDFDNQEYFLLKVEGATGGYIRKIRAQYKKILSDIRDNCFIHKSKTKPHREWLIPANPKVFDIDKGFRETPELEWHQFGSVNEGDCVYIYMAAPVCAIIYKCEVTRANLPPNLEYKTKKPHKTMYLRLIKKYDRSLITRDFMKQYGVGAVRGFRSIPENLSRAIREF